MDFVAKKLTGFKMATLHISIAKDFSEFPAGREPEDGPNSGERFRDEILGPKLREATPDDLVEVDLDGTMGYGSSFLEEAFGGLVRKYKFSGDLLKHKLQIKDSRIIYERMVWNYIEDESKRLGLRK